MWVHFSDLENGGYFHPFLQKFYIYHNNQLMGYCLTYDIDKEKRIIYILIRKQLNLRVGCRTLATPGSLRPLRTVRAAFIAYGSSTFKAYPMRGHPAVNVGFLTTKSSDLFTFFAKKSLQALRWKKYLSYSGR